MNKIYIVVLILLTIILTGCFTKKDIINELGLNNTCQIKKQQDTHGGFLGDGDYFAKIECKKINYKKLSEGWEKLPIPSELVKATKMTMCDDKECSDIYEKYSIPNIKNGYYYFLDRHPDSKDKYDYNNINNRSSYNYTFALLDMDTKTIYYYELDT